MSSCATRSHARVVVVGLLPRQVRQVEQKVRGFGIEVESITLEQSLTMHRFASDLVLIARFCGHKHSRRLATQTHAPIRFVSTGGVSSIVREILFFFLRKRVA